MSISYAIHVTYCTVPPKLHNNISFCIKIITIKVPMGIDTSDKGLELWSKGHVFKSLHGPHLVGDL